ncbi:MAG: ketoacyl-ACP synthase III [Puniceicoccales bacterium]|jgi:3-oxoacyl-[acyl-carrier-protein] synthase-3|nr:ketoacyl-ACP synthase III [Puniceicoccales bacterium]
MAERKRIYVRGIGSYLPEKILTNSDLERMVDTSDEWIVTRTGIRERHIAAEGQITSDLATEAAKKALADADLCPDDVDIVLVTTVVPDMQFPSTACFVQQKLGIGTKCPCVGMEVGCSGMIYLMELAAGLLERGPYRNVLTIAADKLSAVTDWTDRSTCVLLADGAAALVLTSENVKKRAELLGTFLAADGSGAEFLCMPGGGGRHPATAQTVADRLHYLKMNGREVFKRALTDMGHAVERLFERCSVGVDDVAHFIPHQANLRIIEAIAERLSIPMERVVAVLDRTGNTSSASLGIAWDMALQEGRFHEGDLIVPFAFGAGLTSAAALLRWIG